jgi:hypothetical protein
VTLFVDGPDLEPADRLLRWIDARVARCPGALLKLPFDFVPGSSNRATVAGRLIHLEDAALGISLADRLRRPPSRRLWLSVRFTSEDAAAVFATHGEAAPRAQAERPAECLAVRVLGQLHCARGPSRCKRCEAAAAEPATPALLDLCPDHEEAARPTIEVERAGKKTFLPYDVLRRFASLDEARAFVERHA